MWWTIHQVFVKGRKMWCLNILRSANTGATIYNIMEANKKTGLNPYWYFEILFESLTNLNIQGNTGLLSFGSGRLPYRLSLSGYMRKTSSYSYCNMEFICKRQIGIHLDSKINEKPYMKVELWSILFIHFETFRKFFRPRQ